MRTELNKFRKDLRKSYLFLEELRTNNQEFFKNICHKEGKWNEPSLVTLYFINDKIFPDLFKQLDKVINALPKERRKKL